MVALAGVLLASCSHDDGPRVMVVGDSVTVLSKQELQREFDWVSDLDVRATSGLRTDELLPGALRGAAEEPDIGIFLPGYNDVLQDRVDDPALADMVDLSADLPCSVWLLLPTDGGYSSKAVARWNDRVRSLTAEHPNVSTSDEWKRLVEASPDFTFVKEIDAVHPNKDGQRALAKVMSQLARDRCEGD